MADEKRNVKDDEINMANMSLRPLNVIIKWQKNKNEEEIKMADEKRLYVLGKVFHQDDTSPTELLGDVADAQSASKLISDIMNQSFPPKNIFVIEGIKREINIKEVSIE